MLCRIVLSIWKDDLQIMAINRNLVAGVFFSSLSKPCQVVQMFGLNPWFYLRKCNCIKGSNIYNKSGKSYLSSKHLIHVIQTIY